MGSEEEHRLLHDLNNKIVSIMGKAIKVKKKTDNVEALEAVKNLIECCEEAQTIIKDFKVVYLEKSE